VNSVNTAVLPSPLKSHDFGHQGVARPQGLGCLQKQHVEGARVPFDHLTAELDERPSQQYDTRACQQWQEQGPVSINAGRGDRGEKLPKRGNLQPSETWRCMGEAHPR
jgi:hypothetical protein